MSGLHISTLAIRVSTSEGPVGVTLSFDNGLNLIHARNTMGKSICVNSIIYSLGLEGMLSASYDAPFPSAMTDTIRVNGKDLPVLASDVFLEIKNAKDEKATIKRSVISSANKNLVSVWTGFTISERSHGLMQRDFYVREPGAARREAGFHHWLTGFLGWQLPMVSTFKDDESLLYLECIFPVTVVEQKRGWAGFLARIPTHYRIRDVSKRSVEFLLRLDSYENSITRQRLKENQVRIKSDWAKLFTSITSDIRKVDGLVDGVPSDPIPNWPPEPSPRLLLPEGEEWVSLEGALSKAKNSLKQLLSRSTKAATPKTVNLEQELQEAEAALRRSEYVVGTYFDELEQETQVLANVDKRLSAIDQDLRRNKDVQKLRRFGSMTELHITTGECPTCHQALQDTLLSQSIDAPPMGIEENIAFIESQRATFQAIRQNTARSVTAKEARAEAQRKQVEADRTSVRVLRQTLIGERAPEEREIRRRLELEQWIKDAELVREGCEEGLEGLSELVIQWRDVLSALKALPEGDLSPTDEAKLASLEGSLRAQLNDYHFESLPPTSLTISRDTLRPEHERFDFEVNNSASDLIRMIWAYVCGLLEVSRSFETNHPGLIIMDEPKQQGAHRADLGTFLKRLATSRSHRQQIILTTSEEEDTFGTVVEGIRCKIHDFKGKILLPLPK